MYIVVVMSSVDSSAGHERREDIDVENETIEEKFLSLLEEAEELSLGVEARILSLDGVKGQKKINIKISMLQALIEKWRNETSTPVEYRREVVSTAAKLLQNQPLTSEQMKLHIDSRMRSQKFDAAYFQAESKKTGEDPAAIEQKLRAREEERILSESQET